MSASADHLSNAAPLREVIVRLGLFLGLTLAALDVLFGSALPTRGNLPITIVLAELLAGFIAFSVLYGIAAFLHTFCVARPRRRDPRPGLRRIALGLSVVVILGPFTQLVLPLLRSREVNIDMILIPLVLLTPVLVSGSVRKLLATTDESNRRMGLILVIPVLSHVALAAFVLSAHVSLSSSPLNALFLWGGLGGITISAAWRLQKAPRVRVAAVGCTGVCAIVCLAGSWDAIPARAAAESFGPPPSHGPLQRVILLTVDTLRADALGVYSEEPRQTPHLDALAGDSIVFENAVSPAPWTLAAFASILTGLAPAVHGTTTSTSRLPDFPTLADRMHDAGYQTAALGHNPFLLPPFNIARGFAQYEMYPKKHARSVGAFLLGLADPDRFAPDVSTTGLTRKAVAWLEKNRDRQFFFWLHYFDPHMPYEPPREFLPRVAAPPRIGESFDRFLSVREGYFVPTREEIEWIRTLYQAEVRYVDDNIGRLIETLKRLGIYDETLIVFTSDHGEEFWEHGGFEHGHTLYDELLRVPLFVKLPRSSVRRRVEREVTTESIAPTVLDLCAIDYDAALFSSDSLVGLWNSSVPRLAERPIVSAGPIWYERQVAIRFEGSKLITRLLTGREELFDLRSDPGEQRSRVYELPHVLDLARRRMAEHERASRELHARLGAPAGGDAEIGDDALSRLRSLGYIE